MNWLKSLNDSLEFVEENLTENITCEDVSKKAYTSHYHFMRMFYILSGINLGEYIRNRRLTLAASDIVTSNNKIIDIALKYQYNTAESFSKAFKRYHGVTPMTARKKQPVLKMTPKLSFQLQIEGDYIMDYKIVKKDNLNFKGISITTTTDEGRNFKEIPQLWQDIMDNGVFEEIVQYADEMGIVGICYDFDNKSNTFKYMIGVRNLEAQIENAEVAHFDSETFAAFPAKGKLPESIQRTTKQIYGEWFPSSNYEHSMGPELEVYPQGDTSSEEYVCYYWVPINEKK